MNSSSRTTFSGSLSAYWGLSMFTGIAGGIAYGFDSVIMTVITGLFAAGTTYGFLFSRFRKVVLADEKLVAARGLFNNKRVIDLNQVALTVSKETGGDGGTSLMKVDLEDVSDWEEYQHLQLRSTNDNKVILEISRSDFDNEEFIALVKGVKRYTIEYCGTPLEKASHTYQQTELYLEKDKRLKKELLDTLNEAFMSVYEPFETLLSKAILEDLQKDQEVIFQAIKQGNVLVYYRKHKFKDGVSSHSIQVAENLIAATRENLEVVETRLSSHNEVKNRLQGIVNQLRSEQQLSDVASKLDRLQQQNTENPINREDVAHDAEIITQIQELTERINQTETVEKSLVLKEHIKLVNQKDKHGLKDLNKRLDS